VTAVPELVALDLAGPAFVDALRRVWDRGDAAFPLDARLPTDARGRLLDAMAPASVIDASGDEVARAGGQPTEPGDALVMATSGSTGEPKGVVLTHDALAAHAHGVHARLAVDPSRDRWLACLPLAHMGGLGVVTRALIDGVGLDVLPRFDAATVKAAPLDLGSTLISLVPTTLDRLPAAHGFRWVVELRIVDGEIEVSGPTLLRAYRDGTDPRSPDGWLATGDLGEWADDGSLVVHGRRGDLIITGGENVWPAVVEAALLEHPDVLEVAVVGRADSDWGQRVVAFVVPKPGIGPPTLGELQGLASRHLPAYAAPRELVLVRSLPRTALGKLRRADLDAHRSD
jgi:O-succinylbenzoic acid--CoA ligase